MTDADHDAGEADHDADRPDYDPQSPTPPEREPPLRSTAPQSEYLRSQVVAGFVIMLVGLAITFGVPFVMA